MAPNRTLPVRKAFPGTSLAALNTAAPVPPIRPAATPGSNAGNIPDTSGSKGRGLAATGSKRLTPSSGSRSGCVSAYRMGSSMDGKPSCASTDPSANSVSAWITDCGCNTTSIPSNGSPNRKWPSITSSALLARVALSTVILGPIRQVGWLSASSTVARATRSGVHPRNGPPDAVRMRRRSALPPADAMHWSTALCSESMGTISPRPSRAAHSTSSPAMTRVSLLARATRLPAPRAARVAGRAPPAHDRVAYDLDVGRGGPFDQAVGSHRQPGSPPGVPLHQPQEGGARLPGLSLQDVGRSMRGERHHPEPLALAGQYPERGSPDRPGRPQHGNPHAHSPPPADTRPAPPGPPNPAPPTPPPLPPADPPSATAGMAKNSESSRSSTPP